MIEKLSILFLILCVDISFCNTLRDENFLSDQTEEIDPHLFEDQEMIDFYRENRVDFYPLSSREAFVVPRTNVSEECPIGKTP